MSKTMKQGLISVIVPVYNTEKYLEKCIASILAQTYQNIKIYLIDDGSTDGSSLLCDEYAKKDARFVVIHKKNEGQGVARNVALDLIEDGYISFIDSDDYIEPLMFEKMIGVMEDNNADLSICGKKKEKNGIIYEKPVFDQPVIFNNEELIKEYISTSNIFTGMPNKIYKAVLFKGIRFPSLRANEDAYVLPDILKKCKKAVHVGECFYVQFIREGSTENSPFSNKNWALISVAEKLMNFISDYYPQFYHFVAAKKIEDIIYLMRKILIGSSYRKNKLDYIKLESMLKSEYLSIKELYPQSIKKRICLAAEHKYLFRLNCILEKYKIIIIKYLKKQ